MLHFCTIFTNVEISGLSLDFFEAKYDRIYGWEWLMCVITVNCIICLCVKLCDICGIKMKIIICIKHNLSMTLEM